MNGTLFEFGRALLDMTVHKRTSDQIHDKLGSHDYRVLPGPRESRNVNSTIPRHGHGSDIHRLSVVNGTCFPAVARAPMARHQQAWQSKSRPHHQAGQTPPAGPGRGELRHGAPARHQAAWHALLPAACLGCWKLWQRIFVAKRSLFEDLMILIYQ